MSIARRAHAILRDVSNGTLPTPFLLPADTDAAVREQIHKKAGYANCRTKSTGEGENRVMKIWIKGTSPELPFPFKNRSSKGHHKHRPSQLQCSMDRMQQSKRPHHPWKTKHQSHH